MTDTIVRPKVFAQRLGVHLSTLYRMVSDGQIEPARRVRGKPGGRGGAVGWADSYVESVIAGFPQQAPRKESK